MAQASSQPSAPSALLGKETPRIFTPPLRELTAETSLGFECIAFAEQVLEIGLYPWQSWLLVHALELNADGTFRFRKVFVLVGRQNGKSTLLQVLSLWRMYMDHAPLILGTAQDRGLAREQWDGTVEIAQGIEDLASEIAPGSPSQQRGNEQFTLTTGERYKIAASSRRAGRGLSVDLLLMDELREHQSWDAYSAVSKTTNARPKGQLWAVSNAGDAASIVLRHFRRQAHKELGDPDGINDSPTALDAVTDAIPDDIEDDDSLGIFEWSARPGVSVWDKGGWAQSNPSMGHGSMRSSTIAADAKSDPEWVFRTEVLCQWPEGGLEGPFPIGSWEKPSQMEVDGVLVDDENGGCLDHLSKRKKKSPIGVGLDTSWDRSTTYIAIAGWRKDGLIHVELVAMRAGTDWAIPWIVERKSKLNIKAVSFQANGAPVSSLLDEATKADLPFEPWSGSDLGRGMGMLYDKVRFRTVRHLVQPALDIAAATAVTRPAGDAWMWDRKNSPTDIAPLIAVNAALVALVGGDEEIESAYADDDNDLMML